MPDVTSGGLTSQVRTALREFFTRAAEFNQTPGPSDDALLVLDALDKTEAELEALRARVGALADKYEIADATCCSRCADASTFRRQLRAAIAGDS